ncbi:ABC transporter permease [Amycolatopsis jejuensis]|uniref:ABC transporter permease n=1 Tax=Amycolatopsis jejuensis TaxID=330084 RepID=UPI000527F0A6|nr:ABC transporter permease [Amycolatopsis jejuensis]
MTTSVRPIRTVRRIALPATVSGRIGLVLAVLVLAVALFGPFVTPFDPDRTFGTPFAPPDAHFLLGTDFLGRDVLSRLLSGGRSVLLYAGIATVLAYAAAFVIGLVAGYCGSWIDQVLMRTADMLLAFPMMVFVLLVAAGVGRDIGPVVLATAIIQVPSIARVIRTATLEQTVRGFVEAALARGESTFSVLRREILPNLARPIAADAGLRFTSSVLLIAGVNFLGLGLQPPIADWGLMVSENRPGVDTNPLAMLIPAALLGLLTVAINLFGDSLAETER